MLHLVTGVPGDGKTLWTIDQILKRQKAENRPVFYHGITLNEPDFFPNWIEIEEPESWHEKLPPRAIVIFDECQKLFPSMSSGAAVPPHIKFLAEHRHEAFDLYFVTQHPSFAHAYVKRLAGRHYHVKRILGLNKASIYEFQVTRDNPDKSLKDPLGVQDYFYRKELFGKYQSTVENTHKAKIPLKLLLVILIPIALLISGYIAYRYLSGMTDAVAPDTKSSQQLPPQQQTRQDQDGPKKLTREEWLAEMQPRIQGLPHTAPKYDAQTQPKSVPAPQACIASKAKCTCYTDQYTKINMPEDLCRNIVAEGIYMEWQQPAGQQVQPSQPIQQSVPPQASDRVSVMPNSKGSIL